MLNPQQLQTLSAGMKTGGNPSIASSSAPATHDWVDSLSGSSPSPQSSPGYASQVASNIGDTLNQGGQGLVNDIKNTGNIAKQAGDSPLAKVAAVGSTAGHIAGNIAGTAGNILGSFITPLLPDSVKGAIGDVSKHVSDAVDKIPGMTPEIAKSLGDVFNTLTLKGGSEAEAPVKGAIAKGANTAKSITSDVLGKASEAVKPVTGGVTNSLDSVVGKVKEFVNPSLSPEEQVGQIIKGKTTDIPAAQRTFSALSPSLKSVSSMSPKELSSAIDSRIIKPNLSSVDEQFAKDISGGKSIKSFTQTVGDGKGAIKVNHVQNAINELKDYYTKTNDTAGLSKIKTLENKAKINGLTSNDINNLAKLHGNEIKTFNPLTGQAASGLSKQAAENTRAGLKTTARNELGKVNPEAAKEAAALDKQTSEALNTKRLLDKQNEKINTQTQNKGKESGLSKAYNSTTGKVVRTAAKVGVGLEAGKKIIGL